MSKKSERKKEIILLSSFFIFIFSLFFITKNIANDKINKKTIVSNIERETIPIIKISKEKENEYIIQTKNKYYFINTEDNLDIENYLNISFTNEKNKKICLKDKCYSFFEAAF